MTTDEKRDALDRAIAAELAKLRSEIDQQNGAIELMHAALEKIAKGKCEGANLGLPCVLCEHTVAREALASLPHLPHHRPPLSRETT